MELMTPVFLCALVALLPQALGKSSRKFSSSGDLIRNKLHNTNSFTHFNETTHVNKVSDLQSVFMNPICKECHSCMEQSIKAHKVHSHINTNIKTNDIANEIDNIEENTTNRNKRNLEVNREIKIVKKRSQKLKTKKNKNNKSVFVTKYTSEGKVYAIRVKETTTPRILDLQNQTQAPLSKCQVYRVKESFSCDSPDAALILAKKGKINKGNTKEKTNVEINLPIKDNETDTFIVPQFKKRHVAEESQVLETFMPSIEEMY